MSTAGSSSYSTRTSARGFLGGILRLGRDGRDGFTEEFGLADREDRPVRERRPVARHGLRQIRGREDDAHALDRASRAVASIDIDARVRDRQVHELHVQDVVEMDVGDVALRAGDAVASADALVRPSNPLVVG